MEYVTLPYVKKRISKIVFGTATPILFDAIDATRPDLEQCREKAFALLDMVFANGVNCFDCSDHYGEEILGEWIALRGIRDQVVIFSKCAHPNKWRQRVTEFDILYDIHNALAKLRTDYVDIYMLHRDDPTVPVSIIVETLNRLHNEGKIGAFGGSNWTHERIQEANEYALSHGLIPFTVSSPNFGLAEQVDNPWEGACVTISGPENAGARKWYADNNVAVFAYSSLARGFFSGQFKSNEPDKARLFLDEAGIKGYYCERNFERLRRTEILASEKHYTIAQIALSWIFNQPLQVFALTSPVNEIQLKENIAVSDIRLTKEEIAWLNLEREERN